LFTEFHGLSEDPFTITPNPRLAWLGAGMRRVRTELCEAVLEGRGLLILSGGPGVGKSLALTLLASDLEQSGVPCRIHALNCGVGASATDLLRRVPDDAAGNDSTGATDRLTVLLIDEAQHLGSAELGALLHAIALRADCVCLVLAGAPELELAVNEALAEHPVTLATRWSLEPLSPDEISSYIAGRLQAAGGGGREIFTAGAIECLARHSGGVPRRLNVLCFSALYRAWSDGRQVIDASIIIEAALPAPWPSAPGSTSTPRPPLQPGFSRRAEDTPMGGPEPGTLKVPLQPAPLHGVQREGRGPATTRAARGESIAAQTNPPELEPGPAVSRLETFGSARAARPSPLRPSPSGGRWSWRRPALYVLVAGVAAIVFLFVAIEWRARNEPPAGHANAPMIAEAITQGDPSISAATNQQTAPSPSPGRPVAEPVPAEESTAPAMQPADSSISAATNQQTAPSPSPGPPAPEPVPAEESTAPAMQPAAPSISAATNQQTAPSPSPIPPAAEPVPAEESTPPAMPLTNADVPQKDRQGAPTAEGRTPETMGSAELARLLARARQQIKSFALTSPPGDNALETLQRVLAARPGQPDALQGIHDIGSRYALLAVQAEQRGEHALAGRYVVRGLDVVPDHPDLLVIRQKLGASPPAHQSAWITTLVEKLQREGQP
jgi:type II secretory pathway predicted ATPase ExeA